MMLWAEVLDPQQHHLGGFAAEEIKAGETVPGDDELREMRMRLRESKQATHDEIPRE
jgi:hypothetical protein